MSLTPEERQKIYEEEKAKAEAEKPKETVETSTIKELKPNIAGLLCYVGLWISGIVLLVLEKQNQFVRFHAMQSIVVFGFLSILQLIFSFVPVVGGVFNWIIWVAIIILWIVLMYKAYSGAKYKLPVAGDIAENLLKSANAK